MSENYFKRLKIREKLIIADMVVMAVIFLTIFLFIGSIVSADFKDLLKLDTKVSLNIFDSIIKNKGDMLLSEAKRLSERQDLLEAVQSNNEAKVLEIIDLNIDKPKAKIKKADIIDEDQTNLSWSLSLAIVVDKNGRVLARQNNRNQTGDNLLSNKNYPVVQAVLQGLPIKGRKANQPRPIAGFVVLDRKDLQIEALDKQAKIIISTEEEKQQELTKGLFFMAGYPIRSAGETIGAVIVGYLVNHDYDLVNYHSFVTSRETERYKYQAFSSIYLDNVAVSTNIPADLESNKGNSEYRRAIGTKIEEKELTIAEKREKTYQILAVGKKKYITACHPLVDLYEREIGTALIAVPKELYTRGTARFYVLLALVMVMALIAEVIINNRLSAEVFVRPIHRMVEAAKKVELGDLTQQVEIDPACQDELTELSLTFNSMVRDLRKAGQENELTKTELEEKVALLKELIKEQQSAQANPDAGEIRQIGQNIKNMTDKLIYLIDKNDVK